MIYASTTVEHFLTGKAIVRAHLVLDAVLNVLLFSNSLYVLLPKPHAVLQMQYVAMTCEIASVGEVHPELVIAHQLYEELVAGRKSVDEVAMADSLTESKDCFINMSSSCRMTVQYS